VVDLWRDFWIREIGTGQQVAQLHERYMMMMTTNFSIGSVAVTEMVVWKCDNRRNSQHLDEGIIYEENSTSIDNSVNIQDDGNPQETLRNIKKLNFSCEIKRSIRFISQIENRKPGLSERSDVSYLETKRSREINESHELCNVEVGENGSFGATSARVGAKRDERFIKTKAVRLRTDAKRSNAELRKTC